MLKKNKKWMALAIAAGFACACSAPASASVQETLTLATPSSPIDSHSGFGLNTSVTGVLSGHYPVKSLHVTATLQRGPNSAATNQHEAQILVFPPGASDQPFVIQLTRAKTFPASGPDPSFTDYIFTLPVPVSDAAGTWTFGFFESVYSYSAGGPDARWTNLQIGFDNTAVLSNTAVSLNKSGSLWTELEPNDDSSVRANVIAGMTNGDSLTGRSQGSNITADGSGGGASSSDNFIISTTPAPLGIYKYELAASNVSLNCSLRGTGQYPSYASFPSELPFAIPLVGGSGADSLNIQVAEPVGSKVVNSWYGFGKSERVQYRISGTAATSTNYSAILSRSTVTPIPLSGGTLVGETIYFTRTDGSVWDIALYDANLNPVPAGTHEGTDGPFARVLAPGTYYVAIANPGLANSTPLSTTSIYSSTVGLMPYPDAILEYNGLSNQDASITISDLHGHTLTGTAIKVGKNDVVWYVFEVQPGSQPANDMCANAISLISGVTTGFDTALGNTDGSSTSIVCSDKSISMFKDVWFRFVPPKTGPYRVAACNSVIGLTPSIIIYTGTCGSLVPITPSVCGNGLSTPLTSPIGCGTPLQSLNIPILQAGTAYTIRIGTPGSVVAVPYDNRFGQIGVYSMLLNDPIISPYNENTYFLVDAGLSWTEAEAAAVAMGGHLASQHNDDFYWIVDDVLRAYRPQAYNPGSTAAFLGLSNSDGTQLKWSDGTPLDVDNFTYPNNSSTSGYLAIDENLHWKFVGTPVGVPYTGNGLYMAMIQLPPGNSCPADFNSVNGVTVQDIFDFLTAWLAGNSIADFNHVNGVTVQDIFDFLTAWLAGC